MNVNTTVSITKLQSHEPLPMALLLLADPSERLVNEYVQRGQCYIARHDNGAVVGEYVLIPTRPDTVELVNVAVDENYQGQGIGKRLVQHAVASAKTMGYKTIEVGTGSTGAAQLMLYQQCGFRMTWIDREFFVRHYDEPIYENGLQIIDMVRMAQDL